MEEYRTGAKAAIVDSKAFDRSHFIYLKCTAFIVIMEAYAVSHWGF